MYVCCRLKGRREKGGEMEADMIRQYIIRIGAQHVTNKFEKWASNATVVEFDYVTLSFSPSVYVTRGFDKL